MSNVQTHRIQNEVTHNPRIEWIDNVKALLIYAVVLSHVAGIYDAGIILQVIRSFYMAFFFFLSGMFLKPKNDIQKLRQRTIRLLVPFVLIGGIHTILTQPSLSELFFERMHAGYWFIYALTILTFFFSLRNELARLFFSERPFFADIVTIIFADISAVCVYYFLGEKVMYAIALNFVKDFFPFMVAGYWYMNAWLRKGKDLSGISAAICLVVFASLFLLSNLSLEFEYGDYRQLLYQITESPRKFFVSASACGVFLYIFPRVFKYCRTPKWMTYVGTHTLEIYVLHYFLLPNGLYHYFASLLQYGELCNFVIFSAIALLVTALTCCLCVGIERTSILKRILFAKE